MFEQRYPAELEEIRLNDQQISRLVSAMTGPPRKRRRLGRRAAVLIAAAVLLTACAGAAGVALRQARTYYFDTQEEAARAADQAAKESGASAAGYGVKMVPEDYPPQEPMDMEERASWFHEVLEHREGGPRDGWIEMISGVDELTQVTIYQGDSLAGLLDFWPQGLLSPDLAWVEERYAPVPGCQYYGQQEGIGDGAKTSIFYSTTFDGEFQTSRGSPFRLYWDFHPKYEAPDSYLVAEGLDKVEEYTTRDRVTVTIEWDTSVNGQKQFSASFSYGHASFEMPGAEMEAEEIHEILDHLNLSALTQYMAE